MLEKFQKIYDVHDKAGPKDWKALSEWLEKNKFQNVNLPENYVLLMEESNGGIYVSGEREYQFLSLKEIPEYYEAYMFSKFMPFAFPLPWMVVGVSISLTYAKQTKMYMVLVLEI